MTKKDKNEISLLIVVMGIINILVTCFMAKCVIDIVELFSWRLP